MINRTNRATRKPRTKAEMAEYLLSHFEYNGEFAVRIRIRDIRNKTKMEEEALWLAISKETSIVWNVVDCHQKVFKENHKDRREFVLDGRSNGYAVLCATNLKKDEPYKVWSYADLKWRTDLVFDFDKAVEFMIQEFISEAVGEYEYEKANEKT